VRGGLRNLLPISIGVGLVAAFVGHLAEPAALLSVRDVPLFHLPLRTVLAELSREGLPVWNPMIHGGQPILSNPNYAAFYPPTWILLLVPVPYSIGLLLLLHAAYGFAGACSLARHLGCDRGPSLFAATAFAFAGATLSTTNLVTVYCGLAWLPWILLWCDRLCQKNGQLLRLAFTVGAGFALQILAGEPVIVLTTGLAATCLVLTRSKRIGANTSRLALAVSLALLLAAVQLLPTWNRMRDTPRSEGLEERYALAWSSPPQRLVELFLPRFWGDPARIDEGLYFGWKIHDRQFPYVVSIYPGQLVLILSLAGLLRWRVRYRAAWLSMILLGGFLALGAHNPLVSWLRAGLPLLSQIRYPEKFLLLTTSALAFLAALGWQRMLDHRRRPGPALEDFPLALSVLLAMTASLLFTVLLVRPDVGAWFMRRNLPLPPSEEQIALGLRFLRTELLAGILFAGFSAVVIALHRWRRVPTKVLYPLTILILAGDLYHHNRSLTPTVPTADLLEAPPQIRALDPGAGRIFSDVAFREDQSLVLRTPRKGWDLLWSQVGRGDPYVANLWGFSYAFNEDTDLMATGPARSALETLHREGYRSERGQRILGAWSVRYLLLGRPIAEVLFDRLQGKEDALLTIVENPQYRPPMRFEHGVTFHPDATSAREADRATGFEAAQWVASEGGRLGPRPVAYQPRAELLAVDEQAGRIRIRYRAEADVALTAAHTHDSGWKAAIDGEPTPIHLTSLGMMGVLLPGGEHELVLEYWDLYVTAGLIISLASLLTLLTLTLRGGLFDRDPGAPARR
jgi:hypothetical protein